MNRPELLRAGTGGEVRKEIKENLKALEYIGWMLANGYADSVVPKYESSINQIMAEYVIQAEYLRDREANNWGWDKKLVDFSKSAAI